MAPITPHWVQPSHPDLINVVQGQKDYSSYATSKVDLPAGAFFTPITGTTVVDKVTYASVQVTTTTHMDLNSDLLYCDHSCDPSLEFDFDRFEARVVGDKPLKVGDRLTFFYPSSEWEMAQPFVCLCGTARCKRWISGASGLTAKDLRGYWLNKHIAAMLEARDAESNKLAIEEKQEDALHEA